MKKKKRKVIPLSWFEKNRRADDKPVELYKPQNPLYADWKSQQEKYPSVINTKPIASEMPTRYEGEMAEREAKAREEIERKKKRVSITYNKGAYQYLGDDYDTTTIGRK